MTAMTRKDQAAYRERLEARQDEQTDAQARSIEKIVASIARNGFEAAVSQQQDGTVKVQRVGATSFAVVGKRGGIYWR